MENIFIIYNFINKNFKITLNMGTMCCREKEEINPHSKKIMRAIVKDNSQKTYIQIYDIECERGQEIEVNLRFLKLEGMSQLNMNNCLYLCGNNDGKDHTGSSFIKFDPLKSHTSISYLVNSSHSHIYPSMAYYKNEYIIVAGGKRSVKTEIFHKKTNRWKDLPDLPEERFGASLIGDELSTSVFLFGGYNEENKRICCSILKLNLKNSLFWETIIIKSNSAILGRYFSSITKLDKSTYMILGGITHNDPETQEIIEIDIINKTPIVSLRKLNKAATFKDTFLVCESDTNFYLLDDKTTIHKMHKNNSIATSFSFFYVNEEKEENPMNCHNTN